MTGGIPPVIFNGAIIDYVPAVKDLGLQVELNFDLMQIFLALFYIYVLKILIWIFVYICPPCFISTLPQDRLAEIMSLF